MSAAFVAMEQANNELEHLIIAELASRKVGTVAPILGRLSASRKELSEFRMTVRALKFQMDAENFEDLPTLRQSDLRHLGQNMMGLGLISNFSAWERAQNIMEQDGFYGMIGAFLVEADELDRMTVGLDQKVASNEVAAQRRTLSRVLEMNGVNNFKVEFARLYSAWAEFQQFFLASSLISTELWYRHTDVGSLLDDEHICERVAA